MHNMHITSCTRRAGQAGYDGVQIHAAHFFYLSRFISPLFNHRTDRYGGANILPAILSDMRSKTSADFLITIKINSTDEYPGGMTEEDFIAACKLLCCRRDACGPGVDAI